MLQKDANAETASALTRSTILSIDWHDSRNECSSDMHLQVLKLWHGSSSTCTLHTTLVGCAWHGMKKVLSSDAWASADQDDAPLEEVVVANLPVHAFKESYCAKPTKCVE